MRKNGHEWKQEEANKAHELLDEMKELERKKKLKTVRLRLSNGQVVTMQTTDIKHCKSRAKALKMEVIG